jgi:GMP synthase (glutamine-hydrolysing)
MQELAYTFGGEVSPSEHREYGKTAVKHTAAAEGEFDLFKGLDEEFIVWMSHGDKLSKTPTGFKDIAFSESTAHCAIMNQEQKMFGIQFHPEVTHTPQGTIIIKNFLDFCGAKNDWNMTSLIDEFIKNIRELVGPTDHVIGAVSGGVDSSVAAILLNRAIGDRFHAILVDNGLLRKGESEEVVERLRNKVGINLRCVDASERFLGELAGVTDPEKKRKTIGRLFIDIFQEEANKVGEKAAYLLQGTLYPDVIESISYKGPSATIKSHHNVGGLPAHMKLKLIEPLRDLFKDEVRELGIALGIEKKSVWRHPFPGPGLAIRIIGDITKEGLNILREADAIYLEEINKSGDYEKIGQAFCVLLPVKSVGVMGDSRTYEKVIAVRAVATTDYMTADWYPMPYEVLGRISNRIINEVRGINRVCYDISSKPPATIEWE